MRRGDEIGSRRVGRVTHVNLKGTLLSHSRRHDSDGGDGAAAINLGRRVELLRIAIVIERIAGEIIGGSGAVDVTNNGVDKVGGIIDIAHVRTGGEMEGDRDCVAIIAHSNDIQIIVGFRCETCDGAIVATADRHAIP